MSHVITLAARELREKRMTLLIMLCLGLVPVLVPLLPKMRQIGSTDVRDVFVIALLIMLPAGIAIIFGSTVIGRDLQERRLGFYFARPVPAIAIWGGKILGAVLIVLLSAILVALPATFFGSGLQLFFRPGDARVFSPLIYLFVLLALVAISHAAGIILRSRSAWILLDLSLLIVLSYAMVRVIDSFWSAGAFMLATVAMIGVAGVSLLAAFIAGAVQVMEGRTDLRQGHRVLSVTLWSILGTAALLMAVYAGWVHSLDADEVTMGVVESASPRGNWVVIRGGTSGRFDYLPSFLVNPDTQRGVPLGTPRWSLTTVFSGDGEVAAWVKPIAASESTNGTISWAPLSGSDAGIVRDTNLTASLNMSRLVFSPDKSRLAILGNNQVSVVELDGSRLLSSARIPAADVVKAFFVDNDVLRLFLLDSFGPRASKSSLILELNVPKRSLTQTGDLGLAQGVRVLAANAERMIYSSRVPDRLEIRDSRTAQLLVPLPAAASHFSAVIQLSDGTLAILLREGEMVRIALFDWNGTLLREIPLGRYKRAHLGAEPAPGYLAVSTSESPMTATSVRYKTRIVDLAAGNVVRSFDDMSPRAPWLRFETADPTLTFEPGSAASRLMTNWKNGSAVLLDPATGMSTELVGKVPAEWERRFDRIGHLFRK